MPSISRLLIPALATGATAAALAGVEPAAECQYVASRQVALSVDVGAGESVSASTVWASTDACRTWRPLPATAIGPSALRVCVDGDGRYDFYIVVENDAGASGPPPTRGTTPHVSVVVDTVPPTLQARAGACRRGPDGERIVALDCTLIEENLRDPHVRLFCRGESEGLWRDAGSLFVREGRVHWIVPTEFNGRVALRLVATDRAGNRAVDELTIDLSLPLDPPEPASSPAGAAPSVSAVGAPSASLAAAREFTAVAPSPADEHPSPRAAREAQALLGKALEFERRGEPELAAARLREAVALWPGSSDLLASLGGVQLRARRLDQASHAFQRALQLDPKHRAALEGAALVGVAQNRYPEARDHLRKLLELEPRAGRFWLHYGDVEHRLGQRRSALDAWRRVLSLESDESDLRSRALRRLSLFAGDAVGDDAVCATPP
ncbi:MAG: tetratricopeptide repeat protein [Phycisphaerae bacterium]|nr:tetratricopeptide repeat protein [Phycisphaerae bacterium]MCZ2399444.1 tetratricopeptide repeat protein [Phycisphaerae bacterium]